MPFGGRKSYLHYRDFTLFSDRADWCAVYGVVGGCVSVILEIDARQDFLRIDGGNLILHHQFNTKTIPIDTIFKVRRGKFWVERDGKNYSAAYTKLRIHYGKNQYVYVSPADEARFLSELQKNQPLHRILQRKGCKFVTLPLGSNH